MVSTGRNALREGLASVRKGPGLEGLEARAGEGVGAGKTGVHVGKHRVQAANVLWVPLCL